MYYKVVRHVKGKYISPCYHSFLVTYNVNEFVGPIIPNSKLFVFDNLDNAKEFSKDFSWTGEIKIFKCEVLDIDKEIKKCAIYGNDIEYFWKNEPISYQTLLSGVVLVNKVKITEEVNV